MSETPFFTIGIPVFNAEKYLPLCLDSILNQSFRDFELILVNDGSKDNSLNICKDYQARDSRISIIDQENGGVSAASNRVLDVARGTYIYLMDNDDEMFEGILEKAHQYLTEKPVDILHGGYYVKSPGEAAKLRLYRIPNINGGFKNKNAFLDYYIKYEFTPVMWTKFVRRDFWVNSRVRFNSQYDGCQDSDVSSRLVGIAGTVHYVDDVILTWYHPRVGSQSTDWSFCMLRNYWRYTADKITEVFASPEVEENTKYNYLRKILLLRGVTLWKIPLCPVELLRELESTIYPIRRYFRPTYAKNFRDALLYWCIQNFGIWGTYKIIRIGRIIKHCLKPGNV